jgi:hypothetical protein
MSLTLLGAGRGGGTGGGGGGGGPTASAFLARTSGLDATHTNAYIALLDGLDTDGLTSKLDVLHVYATQDSTTALLNLIQNLYNGVAHGSPTFTADRGFTGVDGSTSVYIDTGFNPSTASSPKYVRNSAHVSAWSLRSAVAGSGSSGLIIGAQNSGVQTNIFPRYNDGNQLFRVNGSATAGVANADGTGHYLANRSASNAVQGYKNGSSVLTNSDASVAVFNSNIYVLAQNDTATPATGFGGQVPMASIGSSLSSTDATNFYNRLRTYMTTVGVP